MALVELFLGINGRLPKLIELCNCLKVDHGLLNFGVVFARDDGFLEFNLLRF